MKWNPQTLSVLHSTPRALLITVCAGKQRFALMTAHGPTAATPARELEEWWRELGAIVKKVPRKCILLLGLDANARFKEDTAVPSAAAAVGEAAGHFCRFMEQHMLCSTSLIDMFGKRVKTWTSPNGNETCIDYMCVPQEFHQGFLTLGEVEDFEDLHERDHTPLWAEVRWTRCAHIAGSAFQIDARAIDTPDGRATMRRLLASIPPIPWEMDVDQHLLQLNAHIRDALLRSFPRRPDGPRRQFFQHTARWPSASVLST